MTAASASELRLGAWAEPVNGIRPSAFLLFFTALA